MHSALKSPCQICQTRQIPQHVLSRTLMLCLKRNVKGHDYMIYSLHAG